MYTPSWCTDNALSLVTSGQSSKITTNRGFQPECCIHLFFPSSYSWSQFELQRFCGAELDGTMIMNGEKIRTWKRRPWTTSVHFPGVHLNRMWPKHSAQPSLCDVSFMGIYRLNLQQLKNWVGVSEERSSLLYQRNFSRSTYIFMECQ